MLNWQESILEDKYFPKPEKSIYARLFPIYIDYSDLVGCNNCKIYYNGISFSIHPRIAPNDEYRYILFVNGRHIYFKSVDEAKELAEKICKRIVDAYRELIT